MKVVTTGSNLSIQFKLNRPNTKSYVMIDYFEVKKWEGNNHTASATGFIRNSELAMFNQNAYYEWQTSTAGSLAIWNVSDPLSPSNMSVEDLGNDKKRILISIEELHSILFALQALRQTK